MRLELLDKAAMATADVNDLPDSAFAYIEPGGTKDSSGKTKPRSLRHFPIQDAAHVRNALARAPQSPFGKRAMPAIKRAAKKFGIQTATKAWYDEMKAEPMESGKLDRWLAGKISRRVLMLPFEGPLPGGKAGLDLDGEYFDADTDIYGPFPALRRSRERLVDWHHDYDPVGRMKGAILGHVVFDEAPEDDGLWADFWANAGEERRALVAKLERGGVPLYGSSQAVRGATRKADDGHIEVWPLIRHTITTSPQNTRAVVPPLKALLRADIPDDVGLAAVKAAMIGLGGSRRLRASFLNGGSGFRSGGDRAGKAGRVISKKTEAKLLDLLSEFAERHQALLAEMNGKEPLT